MDEPIGLDNRIRDKFSPKTAVAILGDVYILERHNYQEKTTIAVGSSVDAAAQSTRLYLEKDKNWIGTDLVSLVKGKMVRLPTHVWYGVIHNRYFDSLEEFERSVLYSVRDYRKVFGTLPSGFKVCPGDHVDPNTLDKGKGEDAVEEYNQAYDLAYSCEMCEGNSIVKEDSLNLEDIYWRNEEVVQKSLKDKTVSFAQDGLLPSLDLAKPCWVYLGNRTGFQVGIRIDMLPSCTEVDLIAEFTQLFAFHSVLFILQDREELKIPQELTSFIENKRSERELKQEETYRKNKEEWDRHDIEIRNNLIYIFGAKTT